MTVPERDSTQTMSDSQHLSDCVEKALTNYFDDLDGHDASDLYELIISQAEKPLFEIVLHHYNDNVSRAAQALGLHRRTVLGRLKKYGIER